MFEKNRNNDDELPKAVPWLIALVFLLILTSIIISIFRNDIWPSD